MPTLPDRDDRADIYVHALGTSANVGGEIDGTIIAVCIKHRMAVSYNIAYWSNGDRKEIWVEDWEVSAHSHPGIRIGFDNAHVAR